MEDTEEKVWDTEKGACTGGMVQGQTWDGGPVCVKSQFLTSIKVNILELVDPTVVIE